MIHNRQLLRRMLSTAVAATLCMAAMAETYDATISIDSRIRHQHVTGFGGFSPSPQWSYWLGNNEMDKLFGHADGQLGLNIVRLYMGNTRNSWSSGVANAKRAKRHGAFIFASPWSPPATWKTNNSSDNGGELLESHYADWATMLNDYYKFMQGQGVEIDAVSIQNEPDWKASYQSCIWSGEQMAKFLRENGHLIECKVIAPESIHFVTGMHEPILNDPEACRHLDIMGGHFYGWNGSAYPLATAKGKEVWMTEYLINERQEQQGLDINWRDDGFLMARSINDAMLADMSAWVHYSLKRYYGCLGDGTHGTVNNAITKRGYIMSHYAKYVSGTTRIRHLVADATGQLSSSAYLSQEGDSVIVMVINPSANTYQTSLIMPFNTTGGQQITTTEDVDMQRTDIDLDHETYVPVVTVEPYSVNTYVLTRSSDREDMEDLQDRELVYTDNFLMYGADCVPPGWTARVDNGTREAGQYSLGPRVMAFSAEGVMSHAFYFRSTADVLGMINYGKKSNYPLQLQPGTYTLTYDVVGWKGCHEIMTKVTKQSSAIVAKATVTPEYMVEANGPASRITQATHASLTFEITEAANYILRWDIPKSDGGYNEVLVGNIALARHTETGSVPVLVNPIPDDDTTYDLMGRRIEHPTTPGIYIRGGRKFIVR